MEAIAQNQQELMEVLRQLVGRLGAGPVPQVQVQGQAASSQPAASSPGAASSGEVPPHLHHQAVPVTVAVSSCRPVPPLGTANAIPAARLAQLLLSKRCQTLFQPHDWQKLQRIVGFLGGDGAALNAERSARAYDLAREVREELK